MKFEGFEKEDSDMDDIKRLKSLKVSIIIPAYNVEKYIEKCVESIVMQTHKNIEILVIDDGSKDNTGRILDELALKDERIRAVHKKNGGVSSARNTGLDMATGEYVVFVDADDYLSKDFVEYMLSIVEKTGADFCISKHFITKEGEMQFPQQIVQTLTNVQGTALLLSPDMIVGCHNKMYSRELIEKNHLRFSTDLFYGEGLFFITTVSQLAKRIAVGNRKVYFYRKDNQDSATTRFSIENLRNGWKALDCIENKMHLKNKQIDVMLMLHKCNFSIGAVTRIKASGLKRKYSEDYKYWLSYVRENTPKLIFEKNISAYRKLLLICGCLSPSLLTELDVLRRNYIIKRSVKG